VLLVVMQWRSTILDVARGVGWDLLRAPTIGRGGPSRGNPPWAVDQKAHGLLVRNIPGLGYRDPMNTDWVGWLIGLAAIGIAFWQWHKNEKRGNDVYQFLRGLKGDEQMSKASRDQINDMMQSLKPPKEKAGVQPPPPQS
jgi:hypothetical protein